MATPAGTTWLTVPDLVELLGISQSKVRRLFDEKILLAVRVDGGRVAMTGVFSDGYSLQVPKVTGSVDEGYTVTLNVPV